jgi:4-amino-4-deoxy-L-arabinose transferase
VPLWTMAASMWLFGINEIALRLPSILLTTIGIWLTFSIGSYFFNKKIGYLSAFFYSINGLIIELTGGRVATDHIDIFFLFFVELAVFFSIKFVQHKKALYNILAGVGIGLAILSKWLPALIVFPIWLLIIIDSRNFRSKEIIFQFLVLLITCVAIFLPWQLYIFNTYPLEAKWEAGFNFKHITDVLDERTGPIYYFLDRIRINYGELIYIPLLWFIWKTIQNFKDKKRLAISLWFLIPFLFFSFVKTKMQAYILFASPALFIMTSEFWFALSDLKKSYRLKWLINLLLVLFIALPVRYTIERTKSFEKRERKPHWVTNLKKLSKENTGNCVLFNYDKPIEAMFYTNVTVYPEIPEKTIIYELIEKGYSVIINDNGNIPEDIKKMKDVMTLNLIIGNHDL